MRNATTMCLADSLVSIGLLSRSNAVLYLHSLPEKMIRRMDKKLGGLDGVSLRSLRGKREIACTSKQ